MKIYRVDIEQQQEEDDSGVLDWIKGSREIKDGSGAQG